LLLFGREPASLDMESPDPEVRFERGAQALQRLGFEDSPETTGAMGSLYRPLIP
jgi:hypothetical protein